MEAESYRERFYREQGVDKQLGALIDHFAANGMKLNAQQKARLGRLVKLHGHGQEVFRAAGAALACSGDPIDYMTKRLKGGVDHGRRAPAPSRIGGEEDARRLKERLAQLRSEAERG
ncbi:MAG: hypothetical protein QW838_04150 [Candidatus Nitrosotenuis sp.]